MAGDLPDYYFRIRENGAAVFRVDTENRWTSVKKTRAKIALAVYGDAEKPLSQWQILREGRKATLNEAGRTLLDDGRHLLRAADALPLRTSSKPVKFFQEFAHHGVHGGTRHPPHLAHLLGKGCLKVFR